MTRQSWKAGGEGNGSKRLSEKWLTLTALGEGSVDEVTFFLNWMPPFVQLYAKHLRLQRWDNTLLPFYSLFLVVVAAPFFLRNVACSPFTCAIDWFSKRRSFVFLHLFFFFFGTFNWNHQHLFSCSNGLRMSIVILFCATFSNRGKVAWACKAPFTELETMETSILKAANYLK